MTKQKQTKAQLKRKTTKADQLKSLLAGRSGVTVETLSDKLNWQCHTTRAALTRLKQSGIKIEKLPPTEGSRYSLYRILGANK